MNPFLFLIPVTLLALSVAVSIILVKKGKTPRRAMAIHFLSLALILAVCVMLPFGASPADEAGDGAAATEQAAGDGFAEGMKNIGKYIGAGLAVGLAGIGGGIAVAAGAPAAIGATAEDPKSFGKSIIFVALGEGFGLYGLLISILCLMM